MLLAPILREVSVVGGLIGAILGGDEGGDLTREGNLLVVTLDMLLV